MAASTLQELFVEELRDTYDAEKRLVRALPKIARHAESKELQAALTSHLRETQKQVTRLEQVFRSIDEKPRGKKCDGIVGILEEGNTAMEELDKGPIRDAALLAGCQKVEHYEIASYGTLAYFADLLGHGRAKELLGATLSEEKAADQKLNQLAKSKVNRDALRGESIDEQEGAGFGLGLGGPLRRVATSLGLTSEQPPRAAGRKATRKRAASRRK